MATWMDRTDTVKDREAIGRRFPSLIEGLHYSITSPRTASYNCLPWALGLDQKWYSPEPRVGGYYWPAGIPREWNIASVRLLFSQHGYDAETTDRSLEPGWEKVAFFSDIHGTPSHFARQLSSGAWTSKLGNLHDIEHQGLDCLEGFDVYGPVILVLKRKEAR